MEIHPRTVAARFRADANDEERAAKDQPLNSAARWNMLGRADGLRAAAEVLEQMADAEFERIMAEYPTGDWAADRLADPTGIDAAEAHEGIAP